MSIAIEVIKGGNQQGTFVVKELVYAYAMWISAAFSLKVIRAYDALVTNRIQDTAHLEALLAKTQLLSDTRQQLIDSQQALLDYKDKICAEKITHAETDCKKRIREAEALQWRAELVVDELKREAARWQHDFETIKRSKRPVGNSEAIDILRALYVLNYRTDAVAQDHYRGVGAIRKVRTNYRDYQLPDDLLHVILAANAGMVSYYGN